MTILFSVQEKPFTFSLEDQIIFAKNAGFDGVDYIATIKDLFSPSKKIIQLAKKHGMKVCAVHIPLFLTIYAPEFLLNKISQLLTYFPDCQFFNFHLSGFLTPIGKNIHKLEKFKQLIEKNDITISCESNPDEYVIFKYFPKETYEPDLFAKFCSEHTLPINLDTSHIAAWKSSIITFFKKYQKNINMIHLSDMTEHKQHLSLGKGKLPLTKFFKQIKLSKFTGAVIFEISNFPKNSSKEYILSELRNSLKMFKENVY